MPVRPEEALANMIASLPEKTGKSLEQWQGIIQQKGLAKHGEIVAFLKQDHGLTHGFANQIALRSKPDRAQDEDMFTKRESIRPIYDAVLARIQAFGPDIDLAPKKGYVSVRRNKQFAVLQPAASRLDIGINLKGTEPNGRLEASGSFNAMLSHRVKVSSVEEVNDELTDWLRQAYDQA